MNAGRWLGWVLWPLCWGLAGSVYGLIFGAAGGGWFGLLAGIFVGALLVRRSFGAERIRELQLDDSVLFLLTLFAAVIPLAVYLTGKLLGHARLASLGVFVAALFAPWMVALATFRKPSDAPSGWFQARAWVGYGAILGGVVGIYLAVSLMSLWSRTVLDVPASLVSLLRDPVPLLPSPGTVLDPWVWARCWGTFGLLGGALAGLLRVPPPDKIIEL